MRVGANGKLCRCLKFRTMVRNSEQVLAEVLRSDPVVREQWEREFKLTNDSRITPTGNFLRRTSLDMATGVARIALDTPHHRDLIRHGETGYPCQTLDEFEACMAMLIDNAELRQRIGRAGKAEAQKRFSAATFRESLRAAYGLAHA